MNAIEICDLTVRFLRKRVLDQLELGVGEGQVTVLLGENGAGKSTLLRVLLGVLRPASGTVRVFGQDPLREHRRVLQRIGYVPDVPDCPNWMTPRDLFAFLQPQYSTWNDALVTELVDRLAVPLRTRFKSLSRGQGMKAMLVAALAHEPDLLLLDEPFAGLDQLVREEVLQGVIGALRDGQRTVLCATHELDVAARIADRVAVMQQGRIVRDGTLAAVLGEAEPVQIPSGLQRVLAEALRAATSREEVTA